MFNRMSNSVISNPTQTNVNIDSISPRSMKVGVKGSELHKKKKKDKVEFDRHMAINPMEDTEGLLTKNFEAPLPEPKKKKRRT